MARAYRKEKEVECSGSIQNALQFSRAPLIAVKLKPNSVLLEKRHSRVVRDAVTFCCGLIPRVMEPDDVSIEVKDRTAGVPLIGPRRVNEPSEVLLFASLARMPGRILPYLPR